MTGISAFDALARVCEGGNLRIVPLHQTRDADVTALQNTLRGMLRASSAAASETGSGQLYVAWPWVSGFLPDGQPVHAPLLYIPVRVECRQGYYTIETDAWDEPVWNRTLFLRLALYGVANGIQLPDQQLIRSKLDDLTTFRTFLYEWLRDEHLPIGCSSRWFENRLDSWQERPKTTFVPSFGGLELRYYAAFGLFRPLGSFLADEYRTWMSTHSEESLEEYFVKQFTALPTEGTKLKEHAWLMPITLDSTQESCFRTIRSGGSLVVQGPPGSGKSQLIAALAADFMATGKSVLIVAQKKVALDVVYQRLQSMQLGAFVAELHHFKHDKQTLYQSLKDQIEALESYQSANNTYDAIRLERDFSAVCKEIDILCDWLEEWKSATYSTDLGGYCLHELYLLGRVGIDPGAASLLVPSIELLSWEEHEGQMHAWLLLIEALGVLPAIWMSYAEMPVCSPKRLLDRLKSMHSDLTGFCRTLGNFSLQVPRGGPPEWLHTLAHQSHVSTCVSLLLTLQKRPDASQLISCLQSSATWPYPNDIWQVATITRLTQQATQWLAAQHSRFGKFLVSIGPLPKELRSYLGHAPDASSVQALIHDLNEIKKVLSVAKASGLSVSDASDRAESLRLLQSAVECAGEVSNLFGKDDWDLIPDWSQVYQSWFTIHQSLMRDPILDVSKDTCEAALRILEESIQFGLSNNATLDQLYSIGKSLFKLSPYLLPFLANQPTQQDTTSTLKHARLQLIGAWIQHLEHHKPEACRAGQVLFAENVKRLQVLLRRKQALSQALIIVRLRERTYTALQYNRLQNRVSYRDLHKQVSKKKQIWPVRKLVEEFKHELFDLKPCWLMNPESVSACLPQEALFDLVIFDEASQLYPEQGLAALMRGKQVMIAGDSKQLPPGHWYQMRFDHESDDATADVLSESLMDLLSHYVPSRMLEGHYRSQHPDLIQFANAHFYNGKLRLIPYRSSFHTTSSALQWQQVKGTWQHNVNMEEAQEAVHFLINTLSQGKSVGIVTFNYKQQHLILDMIDTNGAVPPNAAYWVKNIENVQGDEADVVIFSIAYAPDNEGVLPAFFGALNQAGGEKRLNVAITRAKERLVILCSFEPGRLNVSSATHDGPRLLKSFLTYAQAVSTGEVQRAPEVASEPDLLIRFLLQSYPNSRQTTFADVYLQDDRGTVFLTDGNMLYKEPYMKHFFGIYPLHLFEKDWQPVFYTSHAYYHALPLPLNK